MDAAIFLRVVDYKRKASPSFFPSTQKSCDWLSQRTIFLFSVIGQNSDSFTGAVVRGIAFAADVYVQKSRFFSYLGIIEAACIESQCPSSMSIWLGYC